MYRHLNRFIFIMFVLVLSSCASLKLEKPQISLVEFIPKPIKGLEAEFDVVLKINNPNAIALPLQGMSYQIALNGDSLLKGVSNNLPTIKAYGEERITLTISTSLISAPKIVLKLLNNPGKDIRYQFKSKLDLKGMLPSFTIVEEGILPIR